MRLLISLSLLLFTIFQTSAQGVFVSANSGDWNSTSTWTLVSGSDPNGRPDSNDNVTIQSGHNITVSRGEACNNLTFNNGSITYSGNRTLAVGGNVVVSATSTINGFSNTQVFQVAGSLTVNAGVTLNVAANRFDITGATTVNGTLAISGFGAKPRNFGNLTINSGGTMTVVGQDLYTFNGNITNNGTFTANDQTEFRFASASGTIGGSNPMSMYKVVFNSPANYTNNGNLTVRNDMTGTGSFTNGAGGFLELQNGGPFTVTTFNASATGNSITYTGFGNPTSFSGNYYNLILNKSSGTLSFGSSLSVLNDLTIQSGILQVNAVTLTVGNNVNLNGGELTPNNTSAVVNIGGNLNITGGEYDHNNGDVNITGALAVTGGNFFLNGTSSTIDAGSVSLQNVALTLAQGALTSSGAFNLETGSALTGNGAAISTTGTFNMNGGAANFTGGSLTAGAMNIASGLEMFINAVNFSVTGQVALDGTMTFNSSTGTKAAGSILVNNTGNWNVTQPLNITVSGNITNNGTFTGDPGYGTSLYTLTSTTGTISGANNLSIRDVLINSPASYTNNGNLTVASTLTGSGTFTNGATGTFTYAGNNSGGSNFTVTNFNASAVGNTVVYAGTTYSQRWRATSSANNDYYNVTINMGTGDYQRLQLFNNVRVNGTLNILEGDPLLNAFNLELGTTATITGSDATDYIRINSSGIVRQYYSNTGGSVFIPIGDNTNYSPIHDFTLNSGTLGANPYIEFDVTDANHPNRNTNNIAAGGDDDGTAAVSYISRYWTVSGNDISIPQFSAEMEYIDADVTGTEADMIGALRRQITIAMATFDDWLVAGTVNPTTNRVFITDGDGFGDMYAMDNTTSRLPIVLLSFEAKLLNDKVVLNWKTASETNNQYFTIERSYNGVDFEPIIYKDGAGNTTDIKDYVARDLDVMGGRVYYRLKQTDFNGAFEYSEIISVNVPKFTDVESLVRVFPNAVKAGEEINISIENSSLSDITIELISLDGRPIFKISKPLETMIKFQIPNNLRSGYYILTTKGLEFSTSNRIIVQ
jgi:hypothetical protein